MSRCLQLSLLKVLHHSIIWALERKQILRLPPPHLLIQKEHFNKIPADQYAQESLRSSHLSQGQTTYSLQDMTLKPQKAIKKNYLFVNLCVFSLCHHYGLSGLYLGLYLEEENTHSLLLLTKSSPRFLFDNASL